MTNIEEIWKDIPGYNGFQVSDSGRVKKLAYTTKKNNGSPLYKPEKILTTSITKKGYVRVELCLGGLNKKPFTVHRLVMYAFKGLPPEGMDQINHRDGDKTNNRPDNLEWSNNSHNITHAWRTGLFKPNLPNSLDSPHAIIVTHTEYGHFLTVIEAAKESGIDRSKLSKMVKNIIPNTSKYIQA